MFTLLYHTPENRKVMTVETPLFFRLNVSVSNVTLDVYNPEIQSEFLSHSENVGWEHFRYQSD